jgi:hypothetical protein
LKTEFPVPNRLNLSNMKSVKVHCNQDNYKFGARGIEASVPHSSSVELKLVTM